jgi:hypothetical protein
MATFKAFAKIFIFTLYYKNEIMANFYTKEDAFKFKRQFEKTPLYYYGGLEDTRMSEFLTIKRKIGYIENEIDFIKISKMVSGSIEFAK